jgi:hypothetical protein
MYTTFKTTLTLEIIRQNPLTSGQDFVMINAIVTKLNSQLPDATLRINNIDLACDSEKIENT